MRTEAGGDLHGLSLVGGYSVEATPVPIPNTTVKLYCADGTAGVARWESTSLPALFEWPVRVCRRGHFFERITTSSGPNLGCTID